MDLRQLETELGGMGEANPELENFELLFHSPRERSRLSFERGRLELFFRVWTEGSDLLFTFRDEKNVESAVLLILGNLSWVEVFETPSADLLRVFAEGFRGLSVALGCLRRDLFT